MQGHRRRLIVAAVIATVLLVPAIIWSGMQQNAARPGSVSKPAGVSKMPEVTTVGPEMTPYVMTVQEKEKLSLPAWNPPVLMDAMRIEEPKSTIGSEGPYPGMTQTELDKLARWKESAPRYDAAIPDDREPFSTIINVPRARGIEGLTPQERAKLEAYLKSRSR